MRIRVVGAVLSGLFLIFVAYLITLGFAGVGIGFTVTNPVRLVSPEFVYTVIYALSEMLWQFRGIDMVLQGVFLFSAALAASVFFHEQGRSVPETEKE
jgi:hypothetical protein